jgi:hypothetical protein
MIEQCTSASTEYDEDEEVRMIHGCTLNEEPEHDWHICHCGYEWEAIG